MMRVYVDTSVFGGCFDLEFEESSRSLLEEFILGLKTIVISDLTLKELEEAPPNVGKLVEEIPEKHREFVILDNEAKLLACHYIRRAQ